MLLKLIQKQYANNADDEDVLLSKIDLYTWSIIHII